MQQQSKPTNANQRPMPNDGCLTRRRLPIRSAPLKSRVFLFFALALTAIFFSPATAQAQSGGGRAWKNPLTSPFGSADMKKKVETKQTSRWTLKEWLEQKDRNRMMDLWAGMYAPSPYELILSAQYEKYDSKINVPESSSGRQGGLGSVAFFALVLGVEGQYENNPVESLQSIEGLVHLRILGNSNQSTHLNLSYGNRRRTMDGVELNQQVAGAEFDLYIEKHIGLHSQYRYYLPVENDFFGPSEGSKTEAGVFVDIGVMRVFGNWFTDGMKSKPPNSVEIRRDRNGFQYGLKFYF